MSEAVVREAAALRGRGQFKEAINHVESNRSLLDDITRLPALREAFLAADEGGLVSEARRLARELAIEEPGLPSIQRYL